MSEEKVPPEIQTCIIDAIAAYSDQFVLKPECAETLRTCLKVSPSFRWSAKQHLFRTVRLSGDNEEMFLSRIKHLRSLIDLPDVKLGILSHIQSFQMFSPATSFYGIPATTLCEESIQGIEFILGSLRHSEARVHTFEFHGLAFSSLPSRVLQSLLHTIQSPTLVALRFCNVRDLPRDILKNTSISNLTVINCGLSRSASTVVSNISFSLPRLQMIEASSIPVVCNLYPASQESINVQGPCLEMMYLRIDQTSWTFRDINKECNSLVKHFPSIKSLYIVFDSNDIFQLFLTPTLIYSSKLKKINHLTLRYGPTDGRKSIAPLPIRLYLRHVNTILRAWPGNLQRFTLILDHIFFSAQDVSAGPVEAWSVLDNLLNMDRFPLLDGIDLLARYPGSAEYLSVYDQQLEIETAIKLVLPSLENRGKLTVTVSPQT